MQTIMMTTVFVLFYSLLHSPVTEAQKINQYRLLSLKANKEHFDHLKLKSGEDNKTTSINFPTQIIRLKVDLSSKNLECDEVRDKMHTLLDRLDGKDISISSFSGCGVWFDDKEYYVHSAYFDPHSDEGVAYLQQYIEELNGMDFFGVPLEIESAKGVIVSLRIDTGIIESDEPPSFNNSLYHMKSKLYFDSLYDMDNTLINDFSNQLATNNPELISSFIKRWIQQSGRNYSILDYLENLANSNGVKFTLKYTFIMDKEPKAYALTSKTWYLHDCRSYPNEKCIG